MVAKKREERQGLRSQVYKEHPLLKPLSDSASLWRYMSFPKFMSLLERQALFFCKPEVLGDPFEGSISKATPALSATVADSNLQIVESKPAKALEVDLRDVTKHVRVSCWYMNTHESVAMWKLYAREELGLAIRTNFKDFKDALICTQEVSIAEVTYYDYETEAIEFGNPMVLLTQKRKSFEHEREVRALLLDGSESATRSGGCYCEVDLDKLIKEIYVAPSSEQWCVELVQAVAKRYNLEDRIHQSKLGGEPIFTAQVLIPETTTSAR